MKTIEKQFIPYDLALRMKNIGYNEMNFAYFGNGVFRDNCITYNSDDLHRDFESVSAPLWQQAAQFLYITSNKQINFQINGKDSYEELCEKLNKTLEDFRYLQNSKP